MLDDLSGPDRIAELEADNRRLRRLLEQRDAPGELRHRLNGTLGLLRAIIRKSAEAPRDLDGYVAHLEDRLDAIARAQAHADQHGAVELHRLLVDELFTYTVAENHRALVSGPAVHLRPRAGQVMALAIHELAVNSVEHGVLGDSSGRVDISWSIAEAGSVKVLRLDWHETGVAPPPTSARHGFGTEVLTRMLPYELKAETTIVFEAGGLRCTIVLPLSGAEAPAAPIA